MDQCSILYKGLEKNEEIRVKWNDDSDMICSVGEERRQGMSMNNEKCFTKEENYNHHKK